MSMTRTSDQIKCPTLTLSWPQMILNGLNMAPLSYHLGFRIHWNDLVWFWTSFWTWPQALFILENYFELSWRDCIEHNLFIYNTVFEYRFEMLDFQRFIAKCQLDCLNRGKQTQNEKSTLWYRLTLPVCPI